VNVHKKIAQIGPRMKKLRIFKVS